MSKTLMTITRTLSLLLVCVLPATACAEKEVPLEFTIAIPVCRMPPDKLLMPERYSQYEWYKEVTDKTERAGGEGESKSFNGSFWYEANRVDLNGDGYCDWIIIGSNALSTGGDSSILNTFYLGGKSGWKRYGGELKVNDDADIDVNLKVGRDIYQWDFAQSFSYLYEKKHRQLYVIGWTSLRCTSYSRRPGYQFYVWDDKQSNLRLLDRKTPGAQGTQALEYLKKHGAYQAGEKSDTHYHADEDWQNED